MPLKILDINNLIFEKIVVTKLYIGIISDQSLMNMKVYLIRLKQTPLRNTYKTEWPYLTVLHQENCFL